MSEEYVNIRLIHRSIMMKIVYYTCQDGREKCMIAIMEKSVSSEQIRKLVCSTFGHTLVLFTSYSMMGNVYRELRGNLPFPLLKVWKDSQSVIREFKAQKNCVLLQLVPAGKAWTFQEM